MAEPTSGATLDQVLDAYERLWLRHATVETRLRSIDRDLEQRDALPSPHELRTGQTRTDVLAGYAAVRAHQHATPATPAAPGRVHIEGTPLQQHAFHTALATTPPRHPKEPPQP